MHGILMNQRCCEGQCVFVDDFTFQDGRYEPRDFEGNLIPERWDVDTDEEELDSYGTGGYTIRVSSHPGEFIFVETLVRDNSGEPTGTGSGSVSDPVTSGVTIRRADSSQNVWLVRVWAVADQYELRLGDSTLASFTATGESKIKLQLNRPSETGTGSNNWDALCFVDGALVHVEPDVPFDDPDRLYLGLITEGGGEFEYVKMSPCPALGLCDFPPCTDFDLPLFYNLTIPDPFEIQCTQETEEDKCDPGELEIADCKCQRITEDTLIARAELGGGPPFGTSPGVTNILHLFDPDITEEGNDLEWLPFFIAQDFPDMLRGPFLNTCIYFSVRTPFPFAGCELPAGVEISNEVPPRYFVGKGLEPCNAVDDPGTGTAFECGEFQASPTAISDSTSIAWQIFIEQHGVFDQLFRVIAVGGQAGTFTTTLIRNIMVFDTPFIDVSEDNIFDGRDIELKLLEPSKVEGFPRAVIQCLPEGWEFGTGTGTTVPREELPSLFLQPVPNDDIEVKKALGCLESCDPPMVPVGLPVFANVFFGSDDRYCGALSATFDEKVGSYQWSGSLLGEDQTTCITGFDLSIECVEPEEGAIRERIGTISPLFGGATGTGSGEFEPFSFPVDSLNPLNINFTFSGEGDIGCGTEPFVGTTGSCDPAALPPSGADHPMFDCFNNEPAEGDCCGDLANLGGSYGRAIARIVEAPQDDCSGCLNVIGTNPNGTTFPGSFLTGGTEDILCDGNSIFGPGGPPANGYLQANWPFSNYERNGQTADRLIMWCSFGSISTQALDTENCIMPILTGISDLNETETLLEGTIGVNQPSPSCCDPGGFPSTTFFIDFSIAKG